MESLIVLKWIKIIVCFIMVFSFGFKLNSTNKTREIANFTYMLSLVMLWILIIANK